MGSVEEEGVFGQGAFAERTLPRFSKAELFRIHPVHVQEGPKIESELMGDIIIREPSVPSVAPARSP